MKKERKERKIIKWLGDSLDELRTWPKSVTEESGTELLAVQEGRNPSDWKPMTTVGTRVKEIRVSGTVPSIVCGNVCRSCLCYPRIPEEDAKD